MALERYNVRMSSMTVEELLESLCFAKRLQPLSLIVRGVDEMFPEHHGMATRGRTHRAHWRTICNGATFVWLRPGPASILPIHKTRLRLYRWRDTFSTRYFPLLWFGLRREANSHPLAADESSHTPFDVSICQMVGWIHQCSNQPLSCYSGDADFPDRILRCIAANRTLNTPDHGIFANLSAYILYAGVVYLHTPSFYPFSSSQS